MMDLVLDFSYNPLTINSFPYDHKKTSSDYKLDKSVEQLTLYAKKHAGMPVSRENGPSNPNMMVTTTAKTR